MTVMIIAVNSSHQLPSHCLAFFVKYSTSGKLVNVIFRSVFSFCKLAASFTATWKMFSSPVEKYRTLSILLVHTQKKKIYTFQHIRA